MEFFKATRTIDFLKYRRVCVGISTLMIIASLFVVLVYPQPNYGIDFSGGTELQLSFRGDISGGDLRAELSKLGYPRAEVVPIEGKPRDFLIRVRDVSALNPAQTTGLEQALKGGLGGAALQEFKVSPGGDKISLRASQEVPVDAVRAALVAGGVRVRDVLPFGQRGEFRYEAYLVGVADKIVDGLKRSLGERAPDAPLKVEWVGPKAGRQLRDAAVKSLLYAIGLILVYVALRFDMRFAPGGIVALLHDAIVTLGILTVMRREVSLTTIAAVLTIVGYSINDTIVIFDRVRENMHRMASSSFAHIMNVSLTQTLSRTILTSSVTMLSMAAFFFVGTPVIRDLALTLFIGFICGTYSTVYIASPVTEWMDKRFFRRA